MNAVISLKPKRPIGLSGLSNEELVALAQRGNALARDQIVRKNKKWLYMRANRFVRACSHLHVDDLVNEGAIGLSTKAVDKYDPKFGIPFMNYADRWIGAFMRRALRYQDRLVRLPPAVFDICNHWKSASDRGAPDEEIAKKFRARGASDETIRAASDGRLTSFSLDVPAHGDDGPHGATRLDLLTDPSADPVRELDDRARRRTIEERLRPLRDLLSKRMLAILDDRLMAENEPATLQELGDRFEISRERVRQLELQLIERVREALGEMGET